MVINVGTAGVLLWGTIAVTGTIDQFRYLGTVIEARDWLLRQGVEAAHIDAGYALSGWWLYAHAPDGPPSRGREPVVSWVTGWPVLPYMIANVAEPSYAVVRSFRPAHAVGCLRYPLCAGAHGSDGPLGLPFPEGREREGRSAATTFHRRVVAWMVCSASYPDSSHSRTHSIQLQPN
jgi:hypothetical protein